MEWIQTKTEPHHIFIEGGAGVRKTRVAKAMYQSMERFYGTQPGENPEYICCMVLAPIGMASYHVKGNTLHSGLHINLNKAKPTPLGSSEGNTLCARYFKTKAVFMMKCLWWVENCLIKVTTGLGKYLAQERHLETCM